MAFSLGFVLLTHDRPQQAARLVKRLNAMFGFPPIAWHHDFSQCPALPAEALTPNVTVVHPHTETAWGKFSLVEAAMRALETLFASDRAPDGFVLLSGADYPVKPAERILRDLSTSPCDAHIGHEPIIYDRYQRPWQETCYDRYCALHVRLWPGGATLKVRHPLLVAPFVPFTDTFRCYAGEFWFCGRRSAAEYLIARHRSRPELGDHYRVRQYTDEFVRADHPGQLGPKAVELQLALCRLVSARGAETQAVDHGGSAEAAEIRRAFRPQVRPHRRCRGAGRARCRNHVTPLKKAVRRFRA